MSNVYSPRLRELAKEVAKEQDLTLREGVYMYFPGPQFETPAEVRAARVLGADAVGMSTVPEAIAAAHCGYEILGVTLCANMAAGVLPPAALRRGGQRDGGAVGSAFLLAHPRLP